MRLLFFQQLREFRNGCDTPGLRDLAHTRGFKKPISGVLYFRQPSAYAAGMFGKPRKLETEAQVYEAAIKILMRRWHSVHEMKKTLARRCEDEKIVKSVVDRLKCENLLDDARYAKQFTRLRTESRKRGVPDRHIEAAAKETASTTDVATMIRQRIERKLRLFHGKIDKKKLASLYRSLLGAGFPSDLIRNELHRLTQQEVPEVEAGPEQ